MQEIILPDNVKPALEWVNNRILQKVSPQRKHALAQRRFASALGDWADADGLGTVGTEWRFQVQPPGTIRRSLVPDVAYLSYARMPLAEQERSGAPAIAPDAVVDVLSPDDRQRDVEEKVRVYMAAGTNVVFIVDPESRMVVVRDRAGARFLSDTHAVEHASLPGLRFSVRDLFEPPRPR